MARQTLENRVETLEEQMKALEELPARIANLESQFLQFRDEVRVEFSAVKNELRGDIDLSIRAAEKRLRSEMHELNDGVRSEMRELNERVLSQMRVLHEDVIDRIRLLGEG